MEITAIEIAAPCKPKGYAQRTLSAKVKFLIKVK